MFKGLHKTNYRTCSLKGLSDKHSWQPHYLLTASVINLRSLFTLMTQNFSFTTLVHRWCTEND